MSSLTCERPEAGVEPELAGEEERGAGEVALPLALRAAGEAEHELAAGGEVDVLLGLADHVAFAGQVGIHRLRQVGRAVDIVIVDPGDDLAPGGRDPGIQALPQGECCRCRDDPSAELVAGPARFRREAGRGVAVQDQHQLDRPVGLRRHHPQAGRDMVRPVRRHDHADLRACRPASQRPETSLIRPAGLSSTTSRRTVTPSERNRASSGRQV